MCFPNHRVQRACPLACITGFLPVEDWHYNADYSSCCSPQDITPIICLCGSILFVEDPLKTRVGESQPLGIHSGCLTGRSTWARVAARCDPAGPSGDVAVAIRAQAYWFCSHPCRENSVPLCGSASPFQ